MKNIEWIFFDVGSTLVNEEKAYLHRMHDVADAVDEPFEKIYDIAITLYKENKKGDLEVMQSYGLPKLKWHTEDEELYADTVEVLEALSKKSYRWIVWQNRRLGGIVT